MPLLQDAPPERLAEALDALDAAARHLSVAAIAIGFPRSIHLVYATLPNRAVTLRRFMIAGAEPLGIVGYHARKAGLEPYYIVFPECADSVQAREQLRTLATTLTQGTLRSYVLVPGAPPFREPWPGSLDTLLEHARTAITGIHHPRVVFALDGGPELLALNTPTFPSRIHELLAAGATPLGIVGHRLSGTGSPEHETAVPFPQYRTIPWVTQYIESLLEVLGRIRQASGDDPRLVPPSERPPCRRSPRELLETLDAAAARLDGASLVIVLDDGADGVHCDNPARARLLDQFLKAGGTPVGITGSVVHGSARRVRYEVFPEYQREPWALSYLQGLTERLQGNLDGLLVPTSHAA